MNRQTYDDMWISHDPEDTDYIFYHENENNPLEPTRRGKPDSKYIKMPFGKYKGKWMDEIKDANYLKWIHENQDMDLLLRQCAFNQIEKITEGETELVV